MTSDLSLMAFLCSPALSPQEALKAFPGTLRTHPRPATPSPRQNSSPALQLVHATGVLPLVSQVAHGSGAHHQRFDGANHDLVAELLQLLYRG
jgi:hypothetical protein